jgi:signal transduction histidine kinase
MRLPPPHRDDVLIAVFGLLSGVLLWSLDLYYIPELAQRAGALGLVPLTVMCALALLRRSLPQLALPLAVPALVADVLTGSLLVTAVLFSDLVYAAACYGPARLSRLMIPLSAAVTLAGTVTALVVLRDPEALLAGAVVGFLTITPAGSGMIVRNHRDIALAQRLRAEQTALLAEMDRAHAVTAERARMARELHDVVANHLSAIALHSTAALSLDDRRTTRDALGVIRENSTQGLAEMRRLIGILREAGAESAPAATPTLDGLDALVEQARTSGAARGLSFTLLRTVPGPLPAPVELAAYRIAQESLTNAVKHAAPGEVLLELTQHEGRLLLTVTSPYGPPRGPRLPGSGSGLLGMRERTELLGGSLRAGRTGTADERPDHWRVSAELPVRHPTDSRPTRTGPTADDKDGSPP